MFNRKRVCIFVKEMRKTVILKVEELVNYAPTFQRVVDGEVEEFLYETAFYCNHNKLIHQNLRQVLNCENCVTKLDLMEYEAIQRIKWFTEGYFIHNLGSLFSKTPTEYICEKYNIKMSYFRPHLNDKKQNKK